MRQCIDCEKLSKFNSLQQLDVVIYNNIDFKNFVNDNIIHVNLSRGSAKNLEMLSECSALKSVCINHSLVSDNCIVIEDEKYIMKDSSVLASLDNLSGLEIDADEIQDISGILEMDSLETFYTMKDSISESDVKLLEDKGISVIYTDN